MEKLGTCVRNDASTRSVNRDDNILVSSRKPTFILQLEKVQQKFLDTKEWELAWQNILCTKYLSQVKNMDCALSLIFWLKTWSVHVLRQVHGCGNEFKLYCQRIVCHSKYEEVTLLSSDIASFSKDQAEGLWIPLWRPHRSMVQTGNDLIRWWLRTVMTLSAVNQIIFPDLVCTSSLFYRNSGKEEWCVIFLQRWNLWALNLRPMMLQYKKRVLHCTIFWSLRCIKTWHGQNWWATSMHLLKMALQKR